MQKNLSQQAPRRIYKYLDLIILFDVVMITIVNVISGKIIQLSIYTLSAASPCIPITYIFGDIFIEVYGYKQARRATWLLMFTTILSAVIYQIVVLLPPALGFMGNEAYALVLGQVPRIVIGGWTALYSGQFLNDFVLAKMKLFTQGKHLWTRTIGSTIVGQFTDTTLFYIIALSNVIPANLLIKSIVSGWLLKVLIEVVMTPVTYFVVSKLKKVENEDYFDRNTDFNPLIIHLKQNT